MSEDLLGLFGSTFEFECQHADISQSIFLSSLQTLNTSDNLNVPTNVHYLDREFAIQNITPTLHCSRIINCKIFNRHRMSRQIYDLITRHGITRYEFNILCCYSLYQEQNNLTT